MTTSTSLIDLIMSLLRDPAQRAALQQDPESFLASCGDVSAEDVRDAIHLADDDDDGPSGHHVHVPPPPPVHHHPDESDHDAAVRYLNTYVSNNYTDDRETNIDNSLHQDINNRNGHFDQDIDNHSTTASGDGAVAAQGDIDGTVTTGDDNQVGDGNVRGEGNVTGHDNQAVTGDDNTTSFGSGDANSTHVGGSVNVGDGGAFTSDGTAAVDNTDDSVSGSFNDQSHHAVDDAFNDESDDSTHSDTSQHNTASDDHSTETHTDNTTDHSFNTIH